MSRARDIDVAALSTPPGSLLAALRYWHEFMLDAGHKRLTADEAVVYGRDAGWCDAGGYDCAICDVLERQAPLLESPVTTADIVGLVPDMTGGLSAEEYVRWLRDD